MNDYNIEFGHIYMDQNPAKEQTLSLEKLKEVEGKLIKEDKTYIKSILIDDINTEKAILNIGDYTAALDRGDNIDFIFLESTLNIFKDDLLKDLGEENLVRSDSKVFLKGENGKNILLVKENGLGTCNFLVAIWLLARLGVYKDVARWGINLQGKSFSAEKIITILSDSYKSSDDIAKKIIEKTPHKDLINNMEFIYFKI